MHIGKTEFELGSVGCGSGAKAVVQCWEGLCFDPQLLSESASKCPWERHRMPSVCECVTDAVHAIQWDTHCTERVDGLETHYIKSVVPLCSITTETQIVPQTTRHLLSLSLCVSPSPISRKHLSETTCALCSWFILYVITLHVLRGLIVQSQSPDFFGMRPQTGTCRLRQRPSLLGIGPAPARDL